MPAREIHVCGNESAVELVQRLASLMNEEVEVSAARLSRTMLSKRPTVAVSPRQISLFSL